MCKCVIYKIFVIYILCIKENYSPYLTMNQTGFNANV